MRSVPRLTATVSVRRDTEGTDATGQFQTRILDSCDSISSSCRVLDLSVRHVSLRKSALHAFLRSTTLLTLVMRFYKQLNVKP